MTEFDSKELILHKALAEKLVAELTPVLKKLSGNCDSYISKINDAETKLEQTSDITYINEYSRISETQRNKLVEQLILLDRVQKLMDRNKERVDYLTNILSSDGIYNFNVDNKLIKKIEDENTKKISIETIGLAGELAGVKKCYTIGKLFYFKNGKLDFSLDENKNILKKLDSSDIHKLISYYPESVSTIEADSLVDIAFKQNLLKEIASFVYEEGRRKSFTEINKELGNLLRFSTEIPNSLESYIVGVQNMFNAMVFCYLTSRHPSKSELISNKLKCNLNSELIPEGKLIYVQNEEKENENVVLKAYNDDLNYDNQDAENSDDDKIENADETAEILALLGIDVDDKK